MLFLDIFKDILSKSMFELRKLFVMSYLRIDGSIVVELLLDSECQEVTEHGDRVPHVVICSVINSGCR